MTSVKKQKNLTEGALIPQMLLFALPLIATSILQLLFNTADMVVVGRWGGDTPEACANSLAETCDKNIKREQCGKKNRFALSFSAFSDILCSRKDMIAIAIVILKPCGFSDILFA